MILPKGGSYGAKNQSLNIFLSNNPCFRISLLSADMIKIQISKIYFQTQPLSFAPFMIRCQKDSVQRHLDQLCLINFEIMTVKSFDLVDAEDSRLSSVVKTGRKYKIHLTCCECVIL
jgi:hypothetical protein